jgi:hypothetical protein
MSTTDFSRAAFLDELELLETCGEQRYWMQEIVNSIDVTASRI